MFKHLLQTRGDGVGADDDDAVDRLAFARDVDLQPEEEPALDEDEQRRGEK